MTKPKSRSDRKKERTELEWSFLNSLLGALDYEDLRKVISEKYPSVSWRQFADNRHKALWRALQTLDLKTVEERMDVIEKELEGEAKANPINDAPGDDLVMGSPGSAAARQFKEKLIERSSGAAWLERGLELAGLLGEVGGKIYLRGLCESGLNGGLSEVTERLAGRLGFK